MTGKKRKIIIPILAIITILFILDRIVIIRIKYDEGMYDGHNIDFPENMAVTIYKGYGRDSEPYPCFGFKKNMSDGPLYIGLNLFSLNGIGINGKEAYLINDICYVDGKQIYIYYDLSYPDYKVHFWKIIIKTHFEVDDNGELQCEMECGNNENEVKKLYGERFQGYIKRGSIIN